MWYWHKDRIKDQRNRIQGPETNPHTYGQMTFDKSSKIIQAGKTVLSTKGSGRTGYERAEERSWARQTPFIKVNSQISQRHKGKN